MAMRVLATALLAVTGVWTSSDPAPAASMCTGWIEFKGAKSDCVNLVQNDAKKMNFTPTYGGEDTIFFWFGNAQMGVTARCIVERNLIALAAYHSEENQACPLMDRVKDAIYPCGAYRGQPDGYDRAIVSCDQAIARDPRNSAIYNSRCWDRALAGRDLMLALTDCNQSLALRPNNADTLDSRGFTYLKLGQWDNAIADYNAALRINPKMATSLFGRGYAKMKKDDSTGADDITAARKIKSDIGDKMVGYGLQ
jgi:tetratricopeptide (TPR) repeat protein